MAQIKVYKMNQIVVLSIERPEARNALSREIVNEMDAVFTDLKEKNDVRALIIYSKDNFAAGADIKGMACCNEEQARAFAFSDTYNKLENLEIPTIAAIEGYALGGGLELALCCDIRIADMDAKMGFPEVTLGIMPGAGGTIRAPRFMGEAWAKQLIFTGDIIDAKQAQQWGLVNYTSESGTVWDEAQKLAQKLVRRAPVAIAAAKKTIHAGLEEPSGAKGVAIEGENWARLFNTLDQKEGMAAFIEKRKPVFLGE